VPDNQHLQMQDQLVNWQEKIMYIYTYVKKQEEREDLIFEMAKSMLENK